MSPALVEVRPEVADALSTARPVVALETTLVSHGLPRPDNLEVARRVEAVVRERGAVPATIGVIQGQLLVGLADDQLEHLATATDVLKLGVRDLAPALALRRDGATTVASTAKAAAHVGISVLATGGIGGVHRGARESWDESADLSTLAHTPVTVVCSGVKSILDVAATLERLESISVGVAGYRTDRFPGFYVTDSGYPVSWRLDSTEEVARVMSTQRRLGMSQAALVVANPLPAQEQLPPELHDRVLADALRSVEQTGVTGKAVTPHLLGYFHRHTSGRSLRANVALIVGNAALAADIAVAAAGQ